MMAECTECAAELVSTKSRAAVLNITTKVGPRARPVSVTRFTGVVYVTRDTGGGAITEPHVESKLPLSSLKHARKKGNGGGTR